MRWKVILIWEDFLLFWDSFLNFELDSLLCFKYVSLFSSMASLLSCWMIPINTESVKNWLYLSLNLDFFTSYIICEAISLSLNLSFLISFYSDCLSIKIIFLKIKWNFPVVSSISTFPIISSSSKTRWLYSFYKKSLKSL